MSLITPIFEEYKLAEEKVSWILSFLEHLTTISRRTAELYFRCTQIPRNTRWQDISIINIVEMMDKSRNIFDELTRMFEITVINECKAILNRLQEKIQELSDLEDRSNKALQKYLDNLMVCRKNHLDAWTSQVLDTWLTEKQLKSALKAYLDKNEMWNDDLKREVANYENELVEISNKYREIINTSLNIQKNHYKSLLACDDERLIDEQKFKREHFFDFPENDDNIVHNKEEKSMTRFDDAYEEIINDLRTKNPEITKDICIRKHGLFRIKRNYEAKHAFVVVTETQFVHAYELESIMVDLNLTDKHRSLLKKINESNRGMSFFFGKNELLSMSEEKQLAELSDYLLAQLNVNSSTIRGFPFTFKDKLVRLDKEKKEIIITGRKPPIFKNLFVSGIVKIRAFVLRDAYELFFSFCKAIERKEPEIKTDEIECEVGSTKTIQYREEENPWKDEECLDLYHEHDVVK